MRSSLFSVSSKDYRPTREKRSWTVLALPEQPKAFGGRGKRAVPKIRGGLLRLPSQV